MIGVRFAGYRAEAQSTQRGYKSQVLGECFSLGTLSPSSAWSAAALHGYSLLAVEYSNIYLITLYELLLHNVFVFMTEIDLITTKGER